MQLSDTKTQFDSRFISTIRIFAICSIVWGHCNFGTESATYHNNFDLAFQSFAMQVGKMGTILFFLISGFLIQPKMDFYTVFGFFSHRLWSTIVPWIIFVFLLVTVIILNDAPSKFILLHGTVSEIWTLNYTIFKNVVLYHAYWFILVFIISMVVLLLFKKYISNPRMGLLLCLLTLFYCINLHYAWISVHHTKAFLGYAFFMWLGIHSRKHYLLLINWLRATKWTLLLPVLALTITAACIEGAKLTKAGCADPYASIRLSNIVATLVLYVCLFKAGRFKFINRFMPDQIIYGVYLLHNLLLYQQTILLKTFIEHHLLTNSIWRLLGMQLLDFFFILTSSIILVKAFYNRNFIAVRFIDSMVTITNLVWLAITYNLKRSSRFSFMLQLYFILKIYG